nr:DNA-binding protein WhiA [uncultured Oribacterium sp.]
MAEEKQAKKASFSRKVKEELRRIDFTALEKTFKIRTDDEKGRREKLRQVFLSNASLTNPQKEYHLEFVFSKEEEGREVEEILRHYSLHPKQGKRGKNRMVYLKDASEIADVLKLLGAVDALMELENARILKEVSENVNRRVNFEAANINRTVKASLKQQEEIQYIEEVLGLDQLEKALQEVAKRRLQYPDASLEELAQGLEPPIGKSGVNHRLRKLARIAKELREEQSATHKK